MRVRRSKYSLLLLLLLLLMLPCSWHCCCCTVVVVVNATAHLVVVVVDGNGDSYDVNDEYLSQLLMTVVPSISETESKAAR